jgi:arylsulfatase A-like enzyme
MAWFSEAATDLRSPYDDLPDVTATEWRRIREAARQRAEAVFVVDQQIDRIMRALRRSGELSRTLVVFTSDNGFFLGERKIRHGKTLPYAPSGRVPLLVRGPGIPAGQVRDDPYLSIDHAPTIADAAAVTPPYATDGVSMLAVARGGDQGWRRPVLTESRPLAGETQPEVRGIRTARYLYTRWADAEEELFDLSTDPMERHNLARDPEHADVLAQLRSTLTQVQDCRGLECSPALEPLLR